MNTASPPTSKLRLLDPQGNLLEAPREWTPALVEVIVPLGQLANTRLLRQGAPMRLFAQEREAEIRVFAEWPRSGTGRYRMTLEAPDWREDVVVTVAPQKITPDAFSRLVDDLQAELPASIAVGLQ